jgi:hypothetical protein
LWCILIHQMCVFGSTTATEILNLHHFRQNSLIEVIFKSWYSKIAFENFLVFVLLE